LDFTDEANEQMKNETRIHLAKIDAISHKALRDEAKVKQLEIEFAK
jgi:hypothetical protein